MEIVHHSTVTDEMIDGLGHMNVRYYGENADAATLALLAASELIGPASTVFTRDLYTRHHREQMAGAELAVRSGFVAVAPTTATLYHELFNTGTEALAATFLRRVELDGPRPPFPPGAITTIVVPDHGRPRSISLDDDPLATPPALQSLVERRLAMRHPRTVAAEECTADGIFRAERALELFWGGEPVDRRPWDMHHVAPDGARVGMAVMESRTVVGELPRAGDRIQSFSAIIGMGAKTTTRRNWVFDLRTGAALLVSTSVGLAIDLDARRAIELPPSMRAETASVLAPDLA